MIYRYINRISARHFVNSVIVFIVFFAALEIWSALMVREARMRRDIEFLTSVCPSIQHGRELVSTARTFSGAPGKTAPVSLTCTYIAGSTYGKSSRKIIISNP